MIAGRARASARGRRKKERFVTGPYWNPYLETLDRDRLNRLKLDKFKRIVDWAYRRSPFYRDLYDRHGFDPRDVDSLDDVRRVPRVEKSMLQEAQSQGPEPYGSLLALPLDQISEFRQTSGTTGRPVYQADSWADWEWWSECWSHILWSQGYRPADRVFLPFGYNIFVAFWAGHYAAEKIGCEVVPGGVLDTASRVLKIEELKPTAMMGTPTYILNMAEIARAKLGLDPAGSSIRKITCAGEPGALIPGTKQRLEQAWGAKVFDHAGATEIGAWGYECDHQPGGLHVNEAFFLVEIEDPVSGEPVTEPKRPGKMVITALDRLAQPCVRFDSKDLIQWADQPCPCGRTYRLAQGGVLGRADDLTKVKGVLLAPAAVEDVVRSFPECAGEFQIEVRRQGDAESISLKVELEDAVASDEFLPRLKQALRLKTNLGFAVEAYRIGALPRYEVKARRFKDLRDHHD
jgi:phenylacetate-CoA ligase